MRTLHTLEMCVKVEVVVVGYVKIPPPVHYLTHTHSLSCNHFNSACSGPVRTHPSHNIDTTGPAFISVDLVKLCISQCNLVQMSSNIMIVRYTSVLHSLIPAVKEKTAHITPSVVNRKLCNCH